MELEKSLIDSEHDTRAPQIMTTPPNAAMHHIHQHIAAAGGWLGFDRFMHLALYAPGLGYYANDSLKLGAMPADGSDFVTAPELSSLYGQTLAAQVIEALQHTATHEVWEFGAGSGALAEQVLGHLAGAGPCAGALHHRRSVGQPARAPAGAPCALGRQGGLGRAACPPSIEGVVVGNEVLDAMPVQLLVRIDGTWHERGVALGDGGAFIWPTAPPPCARRWRSRANTITSPKSTPRAKPSCAPWPRT